MTGNHRQGVSNGSAGDEKNLTQVVYDRLKTMMLHYQIVPGQRLIFNDLARLMGVSRTPVNNALNILANEGFLDFVPNQGYRVHEITRDEADCLYELREILELGAIDKVIRNLTSEKLAALEKQKILYETAVTEQISREIFTLDQEFHASIIGIAQNFYLTEYFTQIYQRTFLRHRIEGLRADRAREIVKEHEEIYQAIKNRDAARAKALLGSHIRVGKEYIFSVIFRERVGG